MRRILLFAFLTLLFQHTFAQQQVVKLNGEEITALALVLTVTVEPYQHPDSLKNLTGDIPATNALVNLSANGTKDFLVQHLPVKQFTEVRHLSAEDMYLLGRQDAHRYYKGNGAMWGSAVSAFFFPYGYIGSAALAVMKPKVHKNPVSDMRLLADPDYTRGYEARAHSKKIGKVVAGAGIGTVAIFITKLVVSNIKK